MNRTAGITKAFDRPRQAPGLRPTLGQGTTGTRVRLRTGLRCEILEKPWRFEADYDARGDYGPAEMPPSYEEVGYVVRMESESPAARVDELLDSADAHPSILDVFRRAQSVRRLDHIHSWADDPS